LICKKKEYDLPIEIAPGIYWVGFFDTESGLHCNPYIIIENNEAVIIDAGSRPDFPTVMMKILQTGFSPNHIKALIYQHYDPDLCGSIPNLEETIDRDDLKLYTHASNTMFIRHYSTSSEIVSLSATNSTFTFSSGRKLKFIETPYCHAAGSFVTFDEQTGTLFTSDLFGSYAKEWDLFLELTKDCNSCTDYQNCINGKSYCPIADITRFHQWLMSGTDALRLALKKISELPFKIIAPQHGSVIRNEFDIASVFNALTALNNVGIDGKLCDSYDISPAAILEAIKNRQDKSDA
jgi:flavorubredoxin